MKHCCIIGGAGFIGSHLVSLLLARGSQLTVIGRNPAPTRVLPHGVRYLAGDYGDNYFLRGALQGVDEVVSLAYATVPKSSFEDPVHDILSNLPASVRLFEIAAELAVEKLVFVSSGGTVYGKAQTLPIAEDHPTNPISAYGITKLATEKYALMFHELKGLPVLCVRPANAYGEGQRAFTGQGFIATTIAAILERREVVLYGEKGTIRDYIYVSDVASAIADALEYGTPGECYNIGSGSGRSNRDILDALYPLAKYAGLEMKITTMPSRGFDVPANILDCRKLAEISGWEASVPFEEGIKDTWDKLSFMHEKQKRTST
jgi:UDP-glucose 4-epimerase